MARTTNQNDLAPCGHTNEQAIWLGCRGTVCRAADEQLSQQYFTAPPDPYLTRRQEAEAAARARGRR